ncbi:hypothetical protein BJX66DRAFT_53720 [Aspergillus keveii]|uniref:Uncharacterized protein n=1 Tax=Aspergillus keveii TaxID=714993 RepID=A0ABR4GGM0_9EURO
MQPILSVSLPSSSLAFSTPAWRGTVRFLPGLSQWVIRAVASINHIVRRPPPVDSALLTSGCKGCFDQDSPVIKRIRLILCADLIGLPIAPPTPQTPVSHLARSPSTNAKIIHQTLLVASSPTLFSFSNSLVLILGPSSLSSCACVSAPVLSVIPHHAVRHKPCSNPSPPLRLRRSILPSHLLRFFNLLARWLGQLLDTWP